MSAEQIDLIVNILMVDYHAYLEGDADTKRMKLVETAKLILTKLKQQEDETRNKSWVNVTGLEMNTHCSGCYRPNHHCRCSTKN
jgi:hypothetical protein